MSQVVGEPQLQVGQCLLCFYSYLKIFLINKSQNSLAYKYQINSKNILKIVLPPNKSRFPRIVSQYIKMDQSERSPSHSRQKPQDSNGMTAEDFQFEEVNKLAQQLSIKDNQSWVYQIIKEIKQNIQEKQWDNVVHKLRGLIKNENSTQKSLTQLVQLCLYLGSTWTSEPNQTHLLGYVDFFIMWTFRPSNRQQFSKLIIRITMKMLELTLEVCQRIVPMWQIYFDVVSTYTYKSRELGLNEDNWLICWLTMALMLPHATINPIRLIAHEHNELIKLLSKALSSKYLQITRPLLFHKFSLLLRIFISDIEQFMSRDNKLLVAYPKYESINNCSLLMELIKQQIIFESQETTLKETVKRNIQLDCIVLMLTIAESKFKASHNHNQIFEFSIHIVLYLDEIIRGNNGQKRINRRDKNLKVIFYCGQLIGVILHRNCHEVVKICRKDPKAQILSKLLNLYKQAVQNVMKNINQLTEEQIVYKRLVLGFCGLLRINKMQTVIEDTIKETSSDIIKIIQCQHGWHQQELDQVNQQFDESSAESDREQWSEQYYTKNSIDSFEEEDEIETLLRSMWGIKEQNIHIFEYIMNNFDQKQSLMWMVQLERIGLQLEDD